MGHHLTSERLKPDPQKVKAIQEMPKPQDKRAVEHLLGCITYLSRFLPQLTTVTALGPLRQLVEKTATFTWQSQQEEACMDNSQEVSDNCNWP